MNIKTVPMGRGLAWITEGFGLFRRSHLIWAVNFAIYLLVFKSLYLIPTIGYFVSPLLQPILLGGLMLGCRASEKGEQLRIGHLFQGFYRNTSPLMRVGIFSGTAFSMIGLFMLRVMQGMLGEDVLEKADGRLTIDPTTWHNFVILELILSSLAIPIVMATWFAPALVVLDDMSAMRAIKASFVACLRNVFPFLLYVIVLMVLAVLLLILFVSGWQILGQTFLATIPFGLALLALGPTVIASVYVGYRDIFGE